MGGTALKVMAFNIWLGGRLDPRHRHTWGDENLRQLGEFLRAEDPDVLFLVETYGSGDRLEAALNRDQPPERTITGIQVTRPPDLGRNGDNLWLFTRLPVEEVYPARRGGDLSSFNFGGARLGLPDGGHVHAFPVWLYHAERAWSRLTQTATELAMGLHRTYSDEEVVDTDRPRRWDVARTLLDERLPAYVGADDAPVLLGGDFNTMSHLDWCERFADAPGHEGLVLDWPVMRAFADAGFTDTYRHANPDAARHPGRTWSAGHSFMYAPSRIDYVLTRGEAVQVVSSSTRTVRLPEHRGGAMDEQYPFYSDHGAVVTELVIGDATRMDPRADPPVDLTTRRCADLPGRAVPAAELTATATSAEPGAEPERAIDADPRTWWRSREPDPNPHQLTLDLGRPRLLAGVRYQPPIDTFVGIVTRYVLYASDDGVTFRPVAAGALDRDPLGKDIQLDAVSARYLRFEMEAGVGARSAVAELIPYE